MAKTRRNSHSPPGSSTRSAPIDTRNHPCKKSLLESKDMASDSDSEVIIGMRGDASATIQLFVQVSSEESHSSSEEDSDDDDDEFIIFQGNVKHEDMQEIEVVYQGWSSDEEDEDEIDLVFDPVVKHSQLAKPMLAMTHPKGSPPQSLKRPPQTAPTANTEPVSFDIKKTKMGDNGELITTTKSLVFKNLKSAPKKARLTEDNIPKTSSSFASPLPSSLASNTHTAVGSRIPPQHPIPTSAHAKTAMTTRSSVPHRPAPTTATSHLAPQIMKTPLNMNSLTAKAINSTLLLLSELRKRDPVGTALDPATLNARIKAAAQAAVATTTASATNAYHRNSAAGSARVTLFFKTHHQDLEFPKNLEEFAAIFNSQTAVAAALAASKKKAPAPEPMTLDDVLDTNRLDAELLHRSSEVTVTRTGPRTSLPSASDSDHKLTSFRRSQRRAARPLTPSKKEVSKALRKAGAKRLKKMETTLGALLPNWLSPDMKPSPQGPMPGPVVDLGVPPLQLNHEYDDLGTFLLLEQVQDHNI